jgi:Curli production assembly/transport component CsgG
VKTIVSLFTAIVLSAVAHADESGAKITVAIQTAPQATEKISDLLLEIMEIELVGQPGIELVDRDRLRALLAEQSIGEAGVTGEQAAKFGKLVGANYYIFGESSMVGERSVVRCRVVQVETGVYRPVMLVVPNDQDPMAAGAELATKVRAEIGKLAEREIAKPATEAAKFEIPEGAKLPTLAFRIPETSVTPGAANADPAAEKSLEAFVLKQDFKLIQLSRPSQSHQGGSGLFSGPLDVAKHLEGAEHEALLAEAKSKDVNVLILGIAASQRATQIASFHTGRARVELAAVDVKTNRVLATTSAYGIATDLSQFVAEKKAIENATENLTAEFISSIVTAYNK